MPADWKAAKRRQKDTDPTSTKKHGKSHFGYKLSINVDEKYKIIRNIETDTASTHDSQRFDKVFDAGNTSRDVYADRGYPSEEREAWMNENGFRNQIQRESAPSRYPSASSGATSASPRCAPGSRTCSGLSGKWALRTIAQALANFAMTMMTTCCDLKRIVDFRKAGIGAFLRPTRAESALPAAIRGKSGAAPKGKSVLRRRN